MSGKGGSAFMGTAPAGSTTTTQAPWSAQQPYLQSAFQGAANLYNNYSPAYYPFSQVAPLTPAQNAGLSGIENLALSGSPVTGASTNFATSLENGDFLGANPASPIFASLAGSNIGLNNPAASSLLDFSGTNPASSAPGNATLAGLAASNPMSGLPGTGTLSDLSSGAFSLSGMDALRSLAGTNYGASNPGTSFLENLANGENPGTTVPGASTLSDLSGTNVGLSNPGEAALEKYASGGMLEANNPYLKGAFDSVTANVLPTIESSFVNGNNLSNPASAYAASQGVTNAIAPLALSAAQQEEANQIGAATQIQQGALAGNQQRGAFAGDLANLGLQGKQIQAGAAQDVAGNILAGENPEIAAATGAGNLDLGALGVRSSAASSLAGIIGSGIPLQIGAASDLNSNYMTGAGLDLGALSPLESGAVSGANAQTNAATGLSQPFQDTLGRMVQESAFAPTLNESQYFGPSELLSAGGTEQGQTQAQINNAVNAWNYYNQLPYTRLNNYEGAITGNYGSSTSTPYFSNGLADTLGTALGLNMGSNMLFGQGLFGGGSSGGGLLGGLFGGGGSVGSDIGNGVIDLGNGSFIPSSLNVGGNLASSDSGFLSGAGDWLSSAGDWLSGLL